VRSVVVTDVRRADSELVAELGSLGVSTAHEALGRSGYLGPGLRPVQPGSRAWGTAVTAVCWPGDNLMVHAAAEQCEPGDILVVTTISPCTDALLGELIATSLQARGVRGAIVNAGVRDVAMLREMGFPVWSAAISAQGTVKATAGAVNVPVSVGGQAIRPGDAIIADDDGVLCVPASQVRSTLDAARARSGREDATRKRLAAGELGLDIYGMRDQLHRLGVAYVRAEPVAQGKDGGDERA
jgi:4-hydroxy-4-methyl-2-oxoglutarate aldolase